MGLDSGTPASYPRVADRCPGVAPELASGNRYTHRGRSAGVKPAQDQHPLLRQRPHQERLTLRFRRIELQPECPIPRQHARIGRACPAAAMRQAGFLRGRIPSSCTPQLLWVCFRHEATIFPLADRSTARGPARANARREGAGKRRAPFPENPFAGLSSFWFSLGGKETWDDSSRKK